jgi:hypothetical protein
LVAFWRAYVSHCCSDETLFKRVFDCAASLTRIFLGKVLMEADNDTLELLLKALHQNN